MKCIRTTWAMNIMTTVQPYPAYEHSQLLHIMSFTRPSLVSVSSTIIHISSEHMQVNFSIENKSLIMLLYAVTDDSSPVQTTRFVTILFHSDSNNYDHELAGISWKATYTSKQCLSLNFDQLYPADFIYFFLPNTWYRDYWYCWKHHK